MLSRRAFYASSVFMLILSNIYVGVVVYRKNLSIYLPFDEGKANDANYSPLSNTCHYQFGVILGALYFEYSKSQTKETHFLYKVGKHVYLSTLIGMSFMFGALLFYLPVGPKNQEMDKFYSRTTSSFLAPLVPCMFLVGFTFFLLPFISGKRNINIWVIP